MQIGADGRRSQIFLAMSTAAEFRDHLSSFSDFYSSLGPPNPDNVPDDGKLKSEMMLKVNTSHPLTIKSLYQSFFIISEVQHTWKVVIYLSIYIMHE